MTCTHPSHAHKSLGTSSCPRGQSHSNATLGESKWTWRAKLQGPLQTH